MALSGPFIGPSNTGLRTNTPPIGTVALLIPLGDRHQVGDDAELVGRESRAETAETGDDLVEDQQDAVLMCRSGAGARVPARAAVGIGRAGARSTMTAAMLEASCRPTMPSMLSAPHHRFGLAPGEGVLRQMGVGQMIDARQHRAEPLAIDDHAATEMPPKPTPVIAALTADETRARARPLARW